MTKMEHLLSIVDFMVIKSCTTQKALETGRFFDAVHLVFYLIKTLKYPYKRLRPVRKQRMTRASEDNQIRLIS